MANFRALIRTAKNSRERRGKSAKSIGHMRKVWKTKHSACVIIKVLQNRGGQGGAVSWTIRIGVCGAWARRIRSRRLARRADSARRTLCRRSIIFSPTPSSRGSIWWGVRWARAASASLTSAGICSCIFRLRLRNIFPPASSFAIRDSTRSACSRGRMKNPSCRGAAASSARRRRSRNSTTTSALCPSKTAFWKTERRISSWSTSPASIWARTRSCTAAS